MILQLVPKIQMKLKENLFIINKSYNFTKIQKNTKNNKKTLKNPIKNNFFAIFLLQKIIR